MKTSHSILQSQVLDLLKRQEDLKQQSDITYEDREKQFKRTYNRSLNSLHYHTRRRSEICNQLEHHSNTPVPLARDPVPRTIRRSIGSTRDFRRSRSQIMDRSDSSSSGRRSSISNNKASHETARRLVYQWYTCGIDATVAEVDIYLQAAMTLLKITNEIYVADNNFNAHKLCLEMIEKLKKSRASFIVLKNIYMKMCETSGSDSVAADQLEKFEMFRQGIEEKFETAKRCYISIKKMLEKEELIGKNSEQRSSAFTPPVKLTRNYDELHNNDCNNRSATDHMNNDDNCYVPSRHSLPHKMSTCSSQSECDENGFSFHPLSIQRSPRSIYSTKVIMGRISDPHVSHRVCASTPREQPINPIFSCNLPTPIYPTSAPAPAQRSGLRTTSHSGSSDDGSNFSSPSLRWTSSRGHRSSSVSSDHGPMHSQSSHKAFQHNSHDEMSTKVLHSNNNCCRECVTRPVEKKASSRASQTSSTSVAVSGKPPSLERGSGPPLRGESNTPPSVCHKCNKMLPGEQLTHNFSRLVSSGTQCEAERDSTPEIISACNSQTDTQPRITRRQTSYDRTRNRYFCNVDVSEPSIETIYSIPVSPIKSHKFIEHRHCSSQSSCNQVQSPVESHKSTESRHPSSHSSCSQVVIEVDECEVTTPACVLSPRTDTRPAIPRRQSGRTSLGTIHQCSSCHHTQTMKDEAINTDESALKSTHMSKACSTSELQSLFLTPAGSPSLTAVSEMRSCVDHVTTMQIYLNSLQRQLLNMGTPHHCLQLPSAYPGDKTICCSNSS